MKIETNQGNANFLLVNFKRLKISSEKVFNLLAKEGILVRKMNYANLFSWHPNIDIESQTIMSHEDNNKWTDNSDNKISISCLRKSRHKNIK